MTSHSEQRIVPFSPEQLFELVADVERYPDFLPWCVGARIRSKHNELVIADLMIGYKLIRERFTSRVCLNREIKRINTEYTDGPFKFLKNHWVFRNHSDGCLIDFYLEFEFRSLVFQKLVGVMFNEAVYRMVGAFEDRARVLHGIDNG